MAGDDDEKGRSARTAGEVVAALLGIAVGGPVGVVAAAASTEVFVRAAGRALDELRGRQVDRAGRLLEITAHELGEIEPDQVVDGALSSSTKSQLLLESLRAAADATTTNKLRALALALANGLKHDDARADDELLFVRALADLEPIHLRALLACTRVTGITRHGVAVALGLPASGAASAEAAIAVLQRHGLVAVVDDLLQTLNRYQDVLNSGRSSAHSISSLELRASEMQWVRTPFGDACLMRLEQLGSAREDPDSVG